MSKQVRGVDRVLHGEWHSVRRSDLFPQLEATRLGAGIGLLPKFLAIRAAYLRTVHVGQKPLRPALTLAARRDSITRPAVQEVRRALREEIRTRRAELT